MRNPNPDTREGPERTPIHRLLALLLVACTTAPEPFAGRMPTADGSLFVRSEGAGPDLVLLHGLGDSSVTWRKVAPLLRAGGYRVTTVDALGAGDSDTPRGPYDIPAHVRRLREVLDARGIGAAVLVGNSLGGSVALRFCALHPERVRGLVLISPAAYPEGGWTGNFLWERPGLSASLLRAAPARLLAQLALTMNFGDASRITAEDVNIYAAAAARPGTIAAFIEQQRQVMPSPVEIEAWLREYATVAVPVLVLWGTRDRILDPALGERLCRDLPVAELVPLPGIGHAAQLEAPELVAQQVLKWSRRLGR